MMMSLPPNLPQLPPLRSLYLSPHKYRHSQLLSLFMIPRPMLHRLLRRRLSRRPSRTLAMLLAAALGGTAVAAVAATTTVRST